MTPNTYPPAMTGMAQRDDQRLRNSSSGSPPRSGWSSRFLARCSAISRSCPAGSRHIFRPEVNHECAHAVDGGNHSGVAYRPVTGPSCPGCSGHRQLTDHSTTLVWVGASVPAIRRTHSRRSAASSSRRSARSRGEIWPAGSGMVSGVGRVKGTGVEPRSAFAADERRGAGSGTVVRIAAGSFCASGSWTGVVMDAGVGVRGRGVMGAGRRAVVLVAVVCLSAGLLSSCQLGSVTQLMAGGTHVCAVRSDGSVQCWGSNSFGELGDGSVVDRSSPVVVAGLTGVVQVGGGLHFSCAVLVSGSVKCWGDNSAGQLGDGTFTDRSAPVTVTGVSTATQVSSGQGNHVCVRLADATARCWGLNSSGQLGDATTVNRSTPVPVGGLVDVASVATGSGHTCASLAAGTESCWGANASGQLGDGTTTDRLTPVAVAGVSDVAQIAVGRCTVARCGRGTVTCWGCRARPVG
jgi:hypothetical protein